MGTLIKTYFANKLGVNPDKIVLHCQLLACAFPDRINLSAPGEGYCINNALRSEEG